MAKRKRRAKEFKAEAVRVVQANGKTVGAVARELDLTETALREWVRQAEIDAGRGAAGGGDDGRAGGVGSAPARVADVADGARHSSLGFPSPLAFERQSYQQYRAA
jgi:transposase-like protein